MTAAFKEEQLQALKVFNQIQGVASEMNSFVQATRFTAANSIGSTWGDVIAVMQRTQKFADTYAEQSLSEDEQGPKLIIVPHEGSDKVLDMSSESLDLSPEEYAERNYDNPIAFEQCMFDMVRRAQRLFGKYYPYFTPLYESVRGRLAALTDYGTLDADTINSIHRDLMVYLLGLQQGSTFDGEDVIRDITNIPEDERTLAERLAPADLPKRDRKNRKFFVTGFPELIQKVLVSDAGKPAGERLVDKYTFFKWLEPRSSKEGKTWVQIMGVGGMQGTTANQFVESWNDAFQSDEKVVVDGREYRVSDLALGLFYHNFYRLGFNFNPTSTIHLTPTILKVMITIPDGTPDGISYAEFVNKLIDKEISLSSEDKDAFVRQYILNHLDNYKFIFRPKAGTDAANFIAEKIKKSSEDNVFTLTYKELENRNLANLMTVKVTETTVYYKPVIAVRENGKTVYYMVQANNNEQFNAAPSKDSKVKYIKVDPQGTKGRSLDYRTKKNFESYQEID
jgi:hypothetical protein